MKRMDLKLALLISGICFASGFLLLPYQMESLKSAMSANEFEEMTGGASLVVLSLVSSVQLFIMSFILAFLGFKLARNTDFSFDILQSLFEKGKKRLFNRSSLLLSIVLGTVTGFMIVGSDRFYFQYQIQQIGGSTPEFSWLGLFAGVLAGGVFEETLMRLFLVSLLVWIFQKAAGRKRQQLPKSYIWAAIIIASLVFAAGHLPFTSMVFGDLTGMVLFRCFLLNGIGGLFFGYLYWKKGFEYAIVSHMFAHISMQLLFIPLFY